MCSKVLILANSSSGLYDFRNELILELKKKYREVVVSVPENDKTNELKSIGCKVIQTSIDRRGINPFEDLKLLKDYFKILKSEKPELVVTYTIKPNIYGGLACRFKRIPYAVNITGLGTAFQKQGMLKFIVTNLYKLGIKKAKVVFFENVENKQILVRENIVKENQCYVLNGAGVNLERFQVSDYPKENHPTKFLFIGRVMQEKGVDELFEAMIQLQKKGISCTLDILGGYEENYQDIIKNYESAGWLKYHGYQKDVRPFIETAHCFVLPSWHEGMANTNLECAASARPVITSNIHGCKEAVIEGVSGFLCEKQNADSLYEKMKKFTKLTYKERKAMGMAGRKHMEEVFDKRKVVKATIEGLKRV